MADTFDPYDFLVRVPAATLGPNGLNSIRVTFGRQIVENTDDPERFYKIGAIRIEAEPCQTLCTGHSVFVNTGVSRCSWTLGKFDDTISDSEPAAVIDFQIRYTTAFDGTIVYSDTMTLLKNSSGLIVGLGGDLSEGIEFWARILKPSRARTVKLSIMADRLPAFGILLPNGFTLMKGPFIP